MKLFRNVKTKASLTKTITHTGPTNAQMKPFSVLNQQLKQDSMIVVFWSNK